MSKDPTDIDFLIYFVFYSRLIFQANNADDGKKRRICFNELITGGII